MFHVIAKTNHDTGATLYWMGAGEWTFDLHKAFHYCSFAAAFGALLGARDTEAEVIGVVS